MAVSVEYVVEMALIHLAFAQAEIETSVAPSEAVTQALQHIEAAVSNLKRLAPRFDYPYPINVPVDPEAA